MFIEPQIPHKHKGWIEVICGSMFSGKTEELIRRLKRVKIANQNVKIFKPEVDKRYDDKKIVSHDENFILSIPVKSAIEILSMIEDVEVVGIDEAQFFDADLPMVCKQMALKGIRVIIAGLDMDFMGVPFGVMPQLITDAEYVTKVHAICMKCGSIANYSHRTIHNEAQILLGAKNNYEPLCRHCFNDATIS
jgi:thymidine kinase